MIDVEMVRERLATLQMYIDRLLPLQALTAGDFLDDERYIEYWAVQRGLEMAIQSVLDISSHMVAGLRLGRPQEYRDTILLLGKGEVLPMAFAGRLSRVAGFRNIIVHEYLEIDPDQVHRAVTIGLDDLQVFAQHIADYLRQGGYIED